MAARHKHAAGLFSAMALGLLLLIPALAQGPDGGPPGGGPPPPSPGGKGAVGRISAVSATSITVRSREGDTATFTLSNSAAITLDGQAAQADGLKAGEFAAVTSADGTTATAVDAHTHRPPPPGHGPPGGRISAVSATSLTIQTRRGDTKTYTLTASTTSARTARRRRCRTWRSGSSSTSAARTARRRPPLMPTPARRRRRPAPGWRPGRPAPRWWPAAGWPHPRMVKARRRDSELTASLRPQNETQPPLNNSRAADF